MHDYGAKAMVQLQHPGRQASWPRYPMYSASDVVMHLPWSQSHEILYENEEARGKAVRQMAIEDVLMLVDKFSEAAWRVRQAGFDGGSCTRARLPDLPVRELHFQTGTDR